MTTRRLTDRTLLALKRAEGRRYEVWDVETRGLGVRVNSRGVKTFVLAARYPGGANPVRRTLGEYPSMSLAEAREETRRWRKLIAQGIDPKIEQERTRQSELRRAKTTFASVCEDYFRDIKRRRLRRAREVERDIRRELVARWGSRPVTDITRHDVLTVIDADIDRGASWQAHHIYSYASRLFNWAIERGAYGLEASPCDRMRPAKIIGPKEPRTRILTDDELRALWNACARLDYPIGPMVQLLILTGQRRAEVAEARWRELDLSKYVWRIPHDRMKAGAAHVVPLVPDVVAVLAQLPRFNKGDYLFSTTFGAKAINGFSKGKQRIDKAMSVELDSPVTPWVLHDIRRTMRTGLSALPVPDLVRELVIGHTKQGLHKVYDQYAYLDEKRHALELWAARVRSIVHPPPANVVPLRG